MVHACAITSEIIKIGQNRHHPLVPLHRIDKGRFDFLKIFIILILNTWIS